jgi:hypothetical protein
MTSENTISGKTISEKQLAANRANAQKSTGPRSEAGKTRSSLNARRHNLTGQITAMTLEERRAHDAFSIDLIKDMAPQGALELRIAQLIATDLWRLNRGNAVEDNIYALGHEEHGANLTTDHPDVHAALTAARTYIVEARHFDLLTLYQHRINRMLQKNLAIFDNLKVTREQREADAKAERAKRDRIAFFQQEYPYGAPDPPDPPENGFVFSEPTPDEASTPEPVELTTEHSGVSSEEHSGVSSEDPFEIHDTPTPPAVQTQAECTPPPPGNPVNHTYCSANTTSASVPTGAGSSSALEPAATTATYCFPFLPR